MRARPGSNRGALGALRAGLCLAVVVVTAGCTADAINVVDSDISADAYNAWLTSVSDESRTVFTSEDEKVTLSIQFGLNYVATFYVYRIEWIAPGDRLYRAGPVRTEWGTHQVLIESLPIRGHGAADLTGPWKVRLLLQGRPLVERSFEVRAAAAPPEAVADATPPPAAPPGGGGGEASAAARPEPASASPQPSGCPPIEQPPGDCLDRAVEE